MDDRLQTTVERAPGIDVSVLVPAFNAEMTILRAVRSVLAQDVGAIEVIVCDNASTDDTFAVLSGVADMRVKVLRSDRNLGCAGGINAAAEIASGRYFVVLGADDWFAAGALRALQKALESTRAAFAYGAVKYWGLRSDYHVPPAFSPADLYRRNVALYPYLFRRSVWESGLRFEAEPEPGVGICDWDHVLGIIDQGAIGCALPDTLVLHHLLLPRRGTVAIRDNERRLLDLLRSRHPRLTATRL